MHTFLWYWKAFSKKEKAILVALFLFFLLNAALALIVLFQNFTTEEPAEGGELRVGVIGKADSLNPLFALHEGRLIGELLYRGITKYNNRGELVNDIAEKIEVQGNRVYIKLQEVKWSDGSLLTTEDLIFTIESVQNRELGSPEFVNWLGIKVKKISEREVLLELPQPYYPFQERLTIKVLPKKVFSDLSSPRLLSLADTSLYKITSGPFILEEIKGEKDRIKEVILKRNPFYPQKVYPDTLKVFFYETEEEAQKAWKEKRVDIVLGGEEKIENNSRALYLPRYFVLFFNTKRPYLKKAEFRKALSLALDKKTLLERVYPLGKVVDLPDGATTSEAFSVSNSVSKALQLLEENQIEINKEGMFYVTSFRFKKLRRYLKPGDKGEEVKNLQRCLWALGFLEKEPDGLYDALTEKAVVSFQEEYRKEVLEPAGLQKGTGEVGEFTRKKLNETCEKATQKKEKITLNMIVPQDSLLEKVAEEIKAQWQKNLGLETKITRLPLSVIQQEVLVDRNYDMLLLGQELGAIGDYFAFWHSSRIYDPGLNLSLWENKEADRYLERMRQAQDTKEYQENLQKFKEIFQKETPAIILFSPPYLITKDPKVKGCEVEKAVSLKQLYGALNSCYLKTKKIYHLPRWRNW